MTNAEKINVAAAEVATMIPASPETAAAIDKAKSAILDKISEYTTAQTLSGQIAEIWHTYYSQQYGGCHALWISAYAAIGKIVKNHNW